jgi:hypothetical protein
LARRAYRRSFLSGSWSEWDPEDEELLLLRDDINSFLSNLLEKGGF